MGTQSSGGLIAALIALSGCAHTTRTQPMTQEGPFRIGREDVLDIAVWRDPDLSRVLPVRPDGYISLPMIGELQAEGKTPEQLGVDIKKRLAQFVQEPKVSVILREVNSARVYVTGEVTHPGAYPIKTRTSLIQALALAGGLSDFANGDGILVLRSGHNGGIPVRYSDLIANSADRPDFILQPGDTVVVP